MGITNKLAGVVANHNPGLPNTFRRAIREFTVSVCQMCHVLSMYVHVRYTKEKILVCPTCFRIGPTPESVVQLYKHGYLTRSWQPTTSCLCPNIVSLPQRSKHRKHSLDMLWGGSNEKKLATPSSRIFASERPSAENVSPDTRSRMFGQGKSRSGTLV